MDYLRGCKNGCLLWFDAKNGESILEEKYINPDAKGFYDDDKFSKYLTTKGFIYVSDDPIFAFYFAQKNSIALEHSYDYAYLFMIDIDEKDLQADFDDLRIVRRLDFDDYKDYSASDSLEKCGSARIERRLNLSDEVIAYAKIPLQTNKQQTYEYREDMMEIVGCRKEKELTSELREKVDEIFIFKYFDD